MNERICLFMNNSSNVHRYRSIGHRFFFSEFIDSLPASDGESRNLIFDFQIHSFYVVLLVLAIVKYYGSYHVSVVYTRYYVLQAICAPLLLFFLGFDSFE